MPQTGQGAQAYFPLKSPKIGVLGDGQLARMLAQEGSKLGLNIHILGKDAKSPAAQVTSSFTAASLNSEAQVRSFAQKQDLITIESEFFDPMVLKDLNCPVFPQPESLQILRDRLSQKKSLIEYEIPTSPLYEFDNQEQVFDYMKATSKGLVFKQRLFGYDGYGTRILKNLSEARNLFDSEDLTLEEWIAEDFIPFEKELAISFARNEKGQICEFPLVETHQADAKCLWVKGPLDKSHHQKFIQSLKKYLRQTRYIGFITFELFLDKNGLLSVNEVAPRVHNSAHYSLNAMALNQFKAHLMAICNLDLPDETEPISPFAMYNLIAESEQEASQCNLDLKSFDLYLHWYGKAQCRKGRKMGHLTALANSADEALERLKKARKGFSL